MKGGNEILHIKDRIKEKLQEWNGFWLDKDSASTSIIWALVFSCCILVLDSYGAFTYCKNQYGVEYIDKGFSRFLDNLGDNLEKKEYLLPNIVAELLEKNLASVKVLNTSDRWIGITYKEDIEPAQEKFRQMIDSGVYPKNLWQ